MHGFTGNVTANAEVIAISLRFAVVTYRRFVMGKTETEKISKNLEPAHVKVIQGQRSLCQSKINGFLYDCHCV